MVKPSVVLSVLIGLCIGVFIGVTILASVFIESGLTFYEILTILSQLSMLLVAIGTIGFSLFAINRQKTQWLNEEFIKYEAQVLLEFRHELGKAFNAIHFVMGNFYKPFRPAFEPKSQPTITRSKIVSSYNEIQKLNELYNRNQHIFRKHNLEKGMEAFSLLLQCLQYLPERDLQYHLVAIDGVVRTYNLEGWEEKIKSFNRFARARYEPHLCVDVDVMNKLEVDFDSEFERLHPIVDEHLHSLRSQLDRLTMYVEKDTDSLNSRISYFIPPLER